MQYKNEINEDVVKKVVGKIYRDTMVNQTDKYFIKHTYKASQFKDLLNESAFHAIVGFLPNSKYRGSPFVLSVVFNKKTKEYEITVHNPRIKF
jgi:hypothetical protein